MKRRDSSLPERFAVEVDGLTMHDLTEQQAWEMFLLECGQTRSVEVKMHQGDRCVAQRSSDHLGRIRNKA